MTETNPFLLGLSLKDLDSNVRSEISYLDRNLTNGINTQTGNVIANTTSQGGLLRDQMNRSTDFVVSDAHRNTDALSGTVERQNIQGQTLSNQLHCTYEKLSALNTDRIRDNLDDYRAEYTGLKYADHNRHHIHNNLYSGVNRDRDFGREGFGR